jgi:hypothetical protein
MSLESALQQAISNIPECLAGGYVDLTTGMLLGIKTVDSHPQEVMDFLAAATSDLFQGPNVVSIEKIFKKARGKESETHHYFKEIVVLSENLLHIFMRCKKKQDHVVCFVCRKSVNLGMALSKAHATLESVEAAA